MLNETKKYSHIIWDWNGTLLNDAWLCVDVMNGLLEEYDLPVSTLERYRAIFDFPVKDYYEKLGFDFSKDPFEKVGMEFMIRYNQRQKETGLHKEVLDVLEFIHRKGYRQSILSAREQNELRKETADLVEGFEMIPRKVYKYKTASVQEMDLDAIIARNPQVVIVDELAHSDAPGSRHTKRFQDVLEILENGIKCLHNT